MIIKFHVFTDGHDEWFDGGDVDQAVLAYLIYAKRHPNVRLYIEVYQSQEKYELDEEVWETCLLSQGDYPS